MPYPQRPPRRRWLHMTCCAVHWFHTAQGFRTGGRPYARSSHATSVSQYSSLPRQWLVPAPFQEDPYDRQTRRPRPPPPTWVSDPYNDDDDNDSFALEQQQSEDLPGPPLPRRRTMRRGAYDYDRDDYDRDDLQNNDYDYDYDDQYSEEDDLPLGPRTGNLWSNPAAGRSPRQSSGPPRPRRRTFRSGTPPPPAPFRDLYRRLFWYGLEEEDGTGEERDDQEDLGTGDPTMFGGTKGKFNGLAVLQAGGSNGRPGGTLERRARRMARRKEGPDMWRGEDDEGEEELRPRRVARRRPSRPASTDWGAAQVSSWFTEEEEEDSFDDRNLPDDGGVARRRGRTQSDRSPILGVIDTFLGVDRRRLRDRADWYDSQMGNQRAGARLRSPKRTGYAYPLDGTGEWPRGDEDKETIVDVEPLPVEGQADISDLRNANKTISEDMGEKENTLTWQERALAMERVPPVGIPAWGPSGELNMDARTKSIVDALEDITNAERRVKEFEKLVDLAKEEIVILRIDAQLMEKQLSRARRDTRAIQLQLRDQEEKIQYASRKLRLSRSRLKRVKDELKETEARHWAVLSFYDRDHVASNLSEALREFEETEPVAKLVRDETADPPPSSRSTDMNW